MFTGLIEAVCFVKSTQRSGASLRLCVDLTALGGDISPGDSIAVNGVCLTISGIRGGIADFDVSSETLIRSTICELKSGDKVNIERAIRAGSRFGGHFVQGHIDGTGKIDRIDKQGGFWRLTISADMELVAQMIEKGSVAVDGISLTIAKLSSSTFEVAVIPETVKRTTLTSANISDKVNIEIDMLSKLVKRQLSQIMPAGEGLTIEKLRESGF